MCDEVTLAKPPKCTCHLLVFLVCPASLPSQSAPISVYALPHSPNSTPHLRPATVFANGMAKGHESLLHPALRLVVAPKEKPRMPTGGASAHGAVEHLKGLHGAHGADRVKGWAGVVQPAYRGARSCDNHHGNRSTARSSLSRDCLVSRWQEVRWHHTPSFLYTSDASFWLMFGVARIWLKISTASTGRFRIACRCPMYTRTLVHGREGGREGGNIKTTVPFLHMARLLLSVLCVHVCVLPDNLSSRGA